MCRWQELESRNPRAWVASLAVVAAIGCASEQAPDSANTAPDSPATPDTASAAVATATAEPSTPAVPENSPAPPEIAPGRAVYEVPVASAELQPFARFEVGKVSWRVAEQDVRLEYDFPAALSGKEQRVALRGASDAPGRATLSGEAGSAQCMFSEQQVRCDEMMTGLELDPALARSMLSSLPVSERERRGQVIESFSADPIGVLSFAPSSDQGASGERD